MTGGFFYAVVGEMLRQGFTASDIGKVGGGNFCRIFGKVTADTVKTWADKPEIVRTLFA